MGDHTKKIFEGLDHKNKSGIAAAKSSFDLYFQQKTEFSLVLLALKHVIKTV